MNLVTVGVTINLFDFVVETYFQFLREYTSFTMIGSSKSGNSLLRSKRHEVTLTYISQKVIRVLLH